MKIRMLGLLLGATALGVWGTGCEQPSIDCRAARGAFAAKYVLQTGTGACSELKGDVVGLQSYYPAASDGKSVDLTKSHLAVRATRLAQRETAVLGYSTTEYPAESGIFCGDGDSAIVTNEPTSVGNFTSVDPDANAVCAVPTSSIGEFMSNEIAPVGDQMDMANPCKGLPAINMKYEWRNVQVLVSPDAPGTRFQADMTYTEDGCTATYKVCGLWPPAGCEKVVLMNLPDDDPDEGLVPVATGEPEQKLCDDQPDPEVPYEIPYGSGINKDFGAVCDPDLLLCVLPSCPL